MITIKPLEVNQIPAFVDVHIACWEQTYYAIFPDEVMESRKQKRQDFIRHINKRIAEDKNYFYYCLCDDFHIVGILIFSIIDDVGVLDALYLMKDYQNLGYGKKMMQLMERVFHDQGIMEYSIYVFQILSSNLFFKKMGAISVREDLVSVHGKDYQEFEYIKKVV